MKIKNSLLTCFCSFLIFLLVLIFIIEIILMVYFHNSKNSYTSLPEVEMYAKSTLYIFFVIDILLIIASLCVLIFIKKYKLYITLILLLYLALTLFIPVSIQKTYSYGPSYAGFVATGDIVIKSTHREQYNLYNTFYFFLYSTNK